MKVKPPASNIEWTAWARRDPLYAVATTPDRDKGGATPWSDQEFYAIGKTDWEDFRQRWERYGLDRESCVEIGCGAGRITQYMAECFESVHAFDISEDMLEYARRHVTARNVEFRRSSGADLPVFDCTISAVFSCHVFQHFDSLEVGRQYFLEVHRVLTEGGTLMIHVPIYRWPIESRAYEWLYHWQNKVWGWKAMLNRRLIRAGIFRPLMCVVAYPVDWIFQELAKIGFEDIEIGIISLKRNGDPHPFIFARKGTAEMSSVNGEEWRKARVDGGPATRRWGVR